MLWPWCLLAAAGAWASPIPEAFDAPRYSTSSFFSPSTWTFASLSGMPIGKVEVRRLNVFDPTVPGEDWWPFRIANRIHIVTREHVVRRELLQEPGDAFKPFRSLEAERNLRALPMRRAEIIPRPANGKLDLLMETQDSWTLAPQLSVGTEGGDKFFIWGIEENNVLGFAKSVSAYHSQVGARTRNEFRYFDPRLLGSRVKMTDLYATTPHGDEIGVLLDKPFFSLKSDYSSSLLWTRIIQEDVLYRNAETRSKFLHNFRAVQASAAARLKAESDIVQRMLIGTLYQKDDFSSTSETTEPLPQAREMSGPIVGYSLIQPRYIKETYIDNIERVEDFNLGNEFSMSGGPMLRSWGSDRDRWIFSALDQQGMRLGENGFALGQAGLQGRSAAGRFEDAIFFGNLNFFWKAAWRLPQTFVAHLEANTSKRLDGEDQLILGGNTGLRGYKNNSFTGAQTALLNLEDRIFYPKEFFHLLYFGAAVFFDAGVAAAENSPLLPKNIKSDVGVGLRIGTSRSKTGGVFRIDLAYALNQGPGSNRWVLTLRGGQAFQIFNSTNRNAIRTPASFIGEADAGNRIRRQ